MLVQKSNKSIYRQYWIFAVLALLILITIASSIGITKYIINQKIIQIFILKKPIRLMILLMIFLTILKDFAVHQEPRLLFWRK
jgi:hypothetical protein